MRHKKRSTTAKPLRASGIRPAGSATNWEKARDARGPRSQRKKQPRSPKKVQKTREVRRKRGRQRKESDPKANKGNEAASSREAAMDAELRAFAERVALSPQEKQLRTRVFEDVRDLISSAFQDATVQLYGSSSTGLDTFRSDLDITVGNISLSAASQPWPTVVVVDEEDEVVEEQEPTGVGEDEDERLESCARLSTNQPVEEEEESSFSLNLALPVGTAASEDNADITRRVQPTAASHWNPTLRRRKIRVLRALQFLLKAQRPHFQVKCLHKAKIPILMVLDTKTKLSIDIGVNREAFEASEHGRSTSLAHRLQNTLGAPFTTMVMFLKEFLHQFELDKPFTGGLGSFRVYMMVAYIFQRYSSKRKNKPQPPVSTLLLAFFELFGNKKLPNFLHEETQLPLPLGDGGHMDFGGVFRIADCVDTFAMAFDILRSTGNIGSIIYEERLEKDRKSARRAWSRTLRTRG